LGTVSRAQKLSIGLCRQLHSRPASADRNDERLQRTSCEEMYLEELLFKTRPKERKEAEIIGCCTGDQVVTDHQTTTRLVAGQHYYSSHAPRAEGGK
jgi:hypothetical protein